MSRPHPRSPLLWRAPLGRAERGVARGAALGCWLLSVAALGCAGDQNGHGQSSRDLAPARAARPPSVQGSNPTDAAPSPVAVRFLEAHNRERAQAQPRPSPGLAPLEWSEPLARHAQRWAERCAFEHSGGEFGENLAARTDMAPPETVVQDWASEAASYNPRADRCAPGEVCGHYTQVVWRGSERLGCAVAACDHDSPFGSGEWFLWVCSYDPPGNIEGRRPY